MAAEPDPFGALAETMAGVESAGGETGIRRSSRKRSPTQMLDPAAKLKPGERFRMEGGRTDLIQCISSRLGARARHNSRRGRRPERKFAARSGKIWGSGGVGSRFFAALRAAGPHTVGTL